MIPPVNTPKIIIKKYIYIGNLTCRGFVWIWGRYDGQKMCDYGKLSWASWAEQNAIKKVK